MPNEDEPESIAEQDTTAAGGIWDKITARHIWLIAILVLAVAVSLAPTSALYTDFVLFWFPWAHSTQGLHPWAMYTHLFPTEGGRLASCNYPPLVPCFLTLGEAVRPLLHIEAGSVQDMALIKLPFLLTYAGGGPLAYYGLRRLLGEVRAKRTAIAYLLCLPLFVNCVIWGQADTVLCFFLMATVIAVLNDRPVLAGVLFGVSLATKLQAIAAGPVLLVYVYRRFGWRALLLGSIAALGIFGALALPIVLGGGGAGLLKAISGSVGYYPLRTSTAHNPWFLLDTYDLWLHHRPQSVRNDTNPLIGPLSARNFGYLVYGGYLLWVLWRLWQRPDRRRLIVALVISEFAFYMLPTQMHERYILPAIVFAAIGLSDIREIGLLYALFFVTMSIDQYLVVVWGNELITTGANEALLELFAYVGIALSFIYSILFPWATYLFAKETRSTAEPDLA